MFTYTESDIKFRSTYLHLKPVLTATGSGTSVLTAEERPEAYIAETSAILIHWIVRGKVNLSAVLIVKASTQQYLKTAWSWTAST